MRGGSAGVGGTLSSIAGADTQLVFGFTGSPSDVKQLTLDLGLPEDWYSFDVTGTANAMQNCRGPQAVRMIWQRGTCCITVTICVTQTVCGTYSVTW